MQQRQDAPMGQEAAHEDFNARLCALARL